MAKKKKMVKKDKSKKETAAMTHKMPDGKMMKDNDMTLMMKKNKMPMAKKTSHYKKV